MMKTLPGPNLGVPPPPGSLPCPVWPLEGACLCDRCPCCVTQGLHLGLPDDHGEIRSQQGSGKVRQHPIHFTEKHRGTSCQSPRRYHHIPYSGWTET